MNEKRDSNIVVLAILLDLTKAFDTIDYCILLRKLENLAFQGHFVDLFKNYFSNRTPRGRLGKCMRDAVHTTCGVP